MRRRIVLALLGIALAGTARAEVLIGRVVAVADGDTLTLLDADRRQHRVRLAFIDAPEKGQAFGSVAKAKLAELVHGKTVRVMSLGLDRYGRLIGVVDAGQVAPANLVMVAAGLAWHDYADRQPTDDRAAYAQAMQDAQGARRGLWSDPAPVRPQLFRRADR